MSKNKQTFSIRETAETLVPDQFGRTNYLISLGVIVLMVAIIGGLYAQIPSIVPLYFSLPWGEARLVEKIFLLMLPLIAVIIIIINIILAKLIHQLSPLLPRVLAVSTMIVSVMLGVALVGILQSLVL